MEHEALAANKTLVGTGVQIDRWLRAHRRCAWRRHASPAGSTARQAPIRRW
jgi:hypothetical protein